MNPWNRSAHEIHQFQRGWNNSDYAARLASTSALLIHLRITPLPLTRSVNPPAFGVSLYCIHNYSPRVFFNLIISSGAERNNNNKTINGNESKWWQWIRTTMIAKHSKYAAKGGIFNHHVCSVFRRIYPSTTNQNNNKIIIADALFQIQQHALQRIEYTMTCNNQPLF